MKKMMWIVLIIVSSFQIVLAQANATVSGFDLANLPNLTNGRTRSISAENLTGAKGMGGMAVPNPKEPFPAASARAADDLGQGWKVKPFLRVNKGETVTLMDVDALLLGRRDHAFH
jgi:hypothetical protein